MSFIKDIGLNLMLLDNRLESGQASWDEYEMYRESITGFNIGSERFWGHLEDIKKQLIKKDPDAYLQHKLIEAKRLWPHLDTSYSFENIIREIEGAEDGDK